MFYEKNIAAYISIDSPLVKTSEFFKLWNRFFSLICDMFMHGNEQNPMIYSG